MRWPTLTERCIRRTEVDIDSDEFAYGEATADGEYICGGCLTGAEEQAIAEDDMAPHGAVEAAGLSGDADPGAMSGTEYEMREDLAHLLRAGPAD